MSCYTSLLQVGAFVAGLIYAGTMLSGYNPFAYDTSASTSPIGSARQEEKSEAIIEMNTTRAEERRELQEGREADQIETTQFATTGAEKKSAQASETAGPRESAQGDSARIASEKAESKASALYGSKR